MSTTQSAFDVRPVAPGVHVITELGYSHAYSVQGSEWALLIDSGLGAGNIKAVVETLTSKPVAVINTHAHWEHIGGSHLFAVVAIHPLEADKLERRLAVEDVVAEQQAMPEEAYRIAHQLATGGFANRPARVSFLVNHGDPIDLGGGRLVQVLHTPGHTAGSICLLDEVSRLLFTGDTIHLGHLWAHLDDSDLVKYAQTAELLCSMGWDIDLVLPGHGETPLDGGVLLEMGSGFERLMEGEGIYTEVHTAGRTFFDVALGRFSVRIKTLMKDLV